MEQVNSSLVGTIGYASSALCCTAARVPSYSRVFLVLHELHRCPNTLLQRQVPIRGSATHLLLAKQVTTNGEEPGKLERLSHKEQVGPYHSVSRSIDAPPEISLRLNATVSKNPQPGLQRHVQQPSGHGLPLSQTLGRDTYPHLQARFDIRGAYQHHGTFFAVQYIKALQEADKNLRAKSDEAYRRAVLGTPRSRSRPHVDRSTSNRSRCNMPATPSNLWNSGVLPSARHPIVTKLA